MEKIIKSAIKLAEAKYPGVYFLNTTQELKNFYTSGLKKHKRWKAIASIENWLPVDDVFLQDFRKELDKRKIKTQVIFKEAGLKFEPKGLKYRKVKVMSDKYKFKSSVDILNDKLLIMSPKMKVKGLVIEIEPMLDIFNDIFDLLWETLPEVKK
ncbi:MAG: hypothetical protein WCX71_05920 [Candidatus Buchananbacteria bacterium]